MKRTQITLVKIINRPGNHKPNFSKTKEWSEACVMEEELLDIYWFKFPLPRLLCIMEKLNMAKKLYLRKVTNKYPSDTMVPVYVMNKTYHNNNLPNYHQIVDAIQTYGGVEEKGDGPEGNLEKINATITVIMGILFLLKQRNVFEFDACIVEGNSLEDIQKKEKEKTKHETNGD